MGQLGEQSGTGSEDARKVQEALQIVTQDLQGLHKGLITQISDEVKQLQSEKMRLMADIEKLQTYHRALQSRQLETFSQQQIAQQQLWAKQLAQILATHLQAQIADRLNQIAAQTHQGAASGNQPALPDVSGHSDNAHRLLASLDTTFNNTFKTLQRELNSFQSSLSQQINRMHTLEQQGETILEALISRLRDQLQSEATGTSTSPQPGYPYAGASPPIQERYSPLVERTDSAYTGQYEQGENRFDQPQGGYSATQGNPYASTANYQTTSGSAYPTVEDGSLTAPENRYPTPQNGTPAAVNGTEQFRSSHPTTPVTRPTTLSFPATPAPLPSKAQKDVSQVQLGLLLVLISTVALSFHNVVVRIIGKESTILGFLNLGGFIQLGLGNSILILWLRMLVVLPLMIPVAMFLYPPVWRDIRRFLNAPDRRPIFNVVGSGIFLFLSQILIYIAIDRIGPGPAVTILFMYPIVTVPLAWFLFGDRPTPLRWIVMATISVGVILTSLPSLSNASNVSGGSVLTAVMAGIAFAFYLLFMQLGFKKLHPIPVSLIQFFTIFVLTSIILILPFVDLGVQVQNPGGFVLGGIVLGALTLVGYLSNNFGVRFMGAARASIIASSGPVITAVLAWLIIRSPLQFVQILGVLLVTGGVTALSFERMKTVPASKPAK